MVLLLPRGLIWPVGVSWWTLGTLAPGMSKSSVSAIPMDGDRWQCGSVRKRGGMVLHLLFVFSPVAWVDLVFSQRRDPACESSSAGSMVAGSDGFDDKCVCTPGKNP